MNKLYTLTFIFSSDLSRVLLIRKNRPDSMKDLYNGIGGLVEDGEDTYNCAVRETKEETGIYVPGQKPFAMLHFKEILVECFAAQVGDDVFEQASTQTDEEIQRFYSGNVYALSNVVANVPMLVQTAMMSLQNRMSGTYHIVHQPPATQIQFKLMLWDKYETPNWDDFKIGPETPLLVNP